MKKSVVKTLYLMMATVLTVAIFTGCSSKKEEPDKEEVSELETVEETDESESKEVSVQDPSPYEGENGYLVSEKIDFATIPEEFSDIDHSVYDTVPVIHSMTAEQLFGLSIDQFRAFVSVYAPDYRVLYQIRESLIMEESHWNTLRSLISYQLFGTLRDPNLTYEEYEEQTIESLEENAFVRAQDYASGEEDLSSEEYASQLKEEKETIQSMSKEDFVSYINNVFAQTGYTNDDGSTVNIGDMDDEAIDEMKSNLIQNIDDQISELLGDTEEDKSIQDQLMEQNPEAK